MKETINYSPELQQLIDLWQRATDSNDVNAQFELAKRLLKSNNTDMQKKAFALFEKLSNQSYSSVKSEARYMLAFCYENGYGIQQNYYEAGRLYKMVRHSVSDDLHHMSDSFGKESNKVWGAVVNEIVNREIQPELVDCMIESAEGGDVEAQMYLVELYRFGSKYTKPDRKKAIYWAERAAENGDAESLDWLGRMYYNGRDDIAQDTKKGLYLLEEAARQGSSFSAYHVGWHYQGIGEHKTAAKWFRRHAELVIKERDEWLSRNPADQINPNEE